MAMTRERRFRLGDSIGGFLIFLAVVFLAAALRASDDQGDPRLVIRRCNRMLAAVRTDLASLPASREVYDLSAETDRAEADCRKKEKELIA